MKLVYSIGALAFAVSIPLVASAQTTVFSDDFANGSTVNGTSTPGGTPTASSTSYDLLASKSTSSASVSGSGLTYGLTAATTSGFAEVQAVFTSTPITLATAGDYVDLTYTFTDTENLLAGGSSSYILTGLFNSGGYTPVSGSGSGPVVVLSSTAGSAYATGNAANWQGYASRFAGSGGSSEIYTRPLQTAGTASGNQDLLGNAFGGGAYGSSTGNAGTQVGTTVTSALALTGLSQYTIDYRLTLQTSGALLLTENLYSGVGTGGTDLSTLSGTTAVTPLTDTFDSMAFGVRNSGTSLQPDMQINDVTVTDSIQAVPEPSAMALAGLGGVLTLLYRRRVQS